VLIPLSDDAPPGSLRGLRTISREAAPRRSRPRTYRELLDLPEETVARLPRSFDVIGDVAVLKLDPGLETHERAVARSLTTWNPAIRRVAVDSGVEGELRVRALRTVIGDDLLTEHRENGLRYTVDLASAYYSPRLAGERLRIARLVGPGERVLDMFAGVGPIAVLIAKRQPAAEVVAVDANPAAVRFLRANARANKVRLDIREGRIEEVAATLGRFDRIVMDLPRSAERHLATALGLLGTGGGSVHLFTLAAESAGQEPGDSELGTKLELVREQATRAGWLVQCSPRRVRTFATRVWIWCVDLRVSRR
jgi:tRNA (guanine37-N1)-methyltransferase